MVFSITFPPSLPSLPSVQLQVHQANHSPKQSFANAHLSKPKQLFQISPGLHFLLRFLRYLLFNLRNHQAIPSPKKLYSQHQFAKTRATLSNFFRPAFSPSLPSLPSVQSPIPSNNPFPEQTLFPTPIRENQSNSFKFLPVLYFLLRFLRYLLFNLRYHQTTHSPNKLYSEHQFAKTRATLLNFFRPVFSSSFP
jgi:hypothetical protein